MPPPLSAFHSLRRLLEDLRRHTALPQAEGKCQATDATDDDGDPQSLLAHANGRSLVSPYSWPSYCLASRKWSRAAATITIQGVAAVRRSIRISRNPAFDWQMGAPGSDAPRLCTVASARLAHLRFRWLRDAHVGAGHTSHLGDRVVWQIDRCMCPADGFRVWAGHEAECLAFL